MNYKCDFSANLTLEKFVIKLPNHVRRKWTESVDRITSEEKDPSFYDLLEFDLSCVRI